MSETYKASLERELFESKRLTDLSYEESETHSNWDSLGEIAAGTFDCYCTFLPFVGQKIKKYIFGKYSDRIDEEKKEFLEYGEKKIEKSDNSFKTMLNYVAFSGKAKKLYNSMTKLDILDSMEKFWSVWNPIITEKTTKKVYKLLGGRKRPVLSTLGTFAYSGILHALVPPIALGCLLTKNSYVISSVSSMYIICGLPVAISKLRKTKNGSLKDEYGTLDHIKAAITGGIMALYAYGAFELGQYIANNI